MLKHYKLKPYSKHYVYNPNAKSFELVKHKSKGRIEKSVNPQDRNAIRYKRNAERGGYRRMLKMQLKSEINSNL